MPGHPTDFHAVADGNRSFRENDDTADKVTDNILQAKTQAHAHGTGDDGERTEVNAGILYRQVKPQYNDRVTHDALDAETQGFIELGAGQQLFEHKSPEDPLPYHNSDQEGNERGNSHECHLTLSEMKEGSS